MDARGIMEPTVQPQQESRAEQRKKRRVLKRTMKPEKIAQKKFEQSKPFQKANIKGSIKNERAGKQINQARLTNH